MKKEREIQNSIKDKIRNLLGDCIIVENDPTKIRGIPDLLVLFKDRWAALETKRHIKASKRANQPYYVDKMNEMSFAAFISPENEEEVLDAMVRSLRSER